MNTRHLILFQVTIFLLCFIFTSADDKFNNGQIQNYPDESLKTQSSVTIGGQIGGTNYQFNSSSQSSSFNHHSSVSKSHHSQSSSSSSQQSSSSSNQQNGNSSNSKKEQSSSSSNQKNIGSSESHKDQSNSSINQQSSSSSSQQNGGSSNNKKDQSNSSSNQKNSGSSKSHKGESSSSSSQQGSSSSSKKNDDSSDSKKNQSSSSSRKNKGSSSTQKNDDSSNSKEDQSNSSSRKKDEFSSSKKDDSSSSKENNGSSSRQKDQSSSSSSKQDSSSSSKKNDGSSSSSGQKSGSSSSQQIGGLSNRQNGQSNSTLSQQSGSSSNQNSQSKSSSSQQSGSSSNQSGQSNSSPTQSQQQHNNSSSSNQQDEQYSSSTLKIDLNININFNKSFQGVFEKVYAFGDSYTDTGNAFMVQGLKLFATEMLKSSPLVKKMSGQRLCNGRLTIDFICEALKLPNLPAYKLPSANFNRGVNFATAGSTTIAHNIVSSFPINNNLFWQGPPQSFQTQIKWFNNFLLSVDCKDKTQQECEAVVGKALFWVGGVGITDFARVFGTSVSSSVLLKQTIDFVTKLLETILSRGGKFIVVQALPPLGCSPLHLTFTPIKLRDEMGCSAKVNGMAKAYNDKLEELVAQFRTKYPYCKIIFADTWGAYKEVVAASRNFDISEPFKACCGAGGGPLNFNLQHLCGKPGSSQCKNPNEFIYWDGLHWSEAMNFHIADLLINRGYCNPPFEDLIKTRMGK